MAKNLANITVQFDVNTGIITLSIDSSKSVGTTAKGDSTYFANTAGPIDVPDVPGLKLAMAMWYRAPQHGAAQPAVAVQASGVSLVSHDATPTSDKAPRKATKPVVAINHHRG